MNNTELDTFEKRYNFDVSKLIEKNELIEKINKNKCKIEKQE